MKWWLAVEDARGQILVSLRDQVQRHAWKFSEEKKQERQLRWWGLTLLPQVFYGGAFSLMVITIPFRGEMVGERKRTFRAKI